MRHPIFQSRTFIIYMLVWLGLALTQTIISIKTLGTPMEAALLDGLLAHLWAAALGISLWYALAYHVFKQTLLSNSLHLFVDHFLLGGTYALLWAGGIYTVFTTLYADDPGALAILQSAHPWRLGAGIIYYALLVLTYSLFNSMHALRERIENEARLQSLLHQSELSLLKSQLNPHFLFNSLNSVSALVELDPEKAQHMITNLAEFLRYSISAPAHSHVTLEEELKYNRRYLSIERIRFGDKLSCHEEIASECLQAKVPAMLLQPLYENAIKHGTAECLGPAHIRTMVTLEQNYLHLTISNTVERPSTRKGTGMGQRNVRDRLRLFYGEGKVRMQTQLAADCYTVDIYLPYGV
jgi:two-component system, LytTR family, sensor kinase